tara:strand:- start:376 stop:822 length:447 start_codon:yes stop_codon:yes gene_type:complete
MTPDQLRQHVIAPTLINMGMWSQEAEDLLLETAMHESDRLKRITQYTGPALSYYQIEPATLHDLYDSFLRYKPELLKKLDGFRSPNLSQNDNLRMNGAYATAAARLQYYRQPGAIPDTIEGRAAYWKRYWNTPLGRGTEIKYINDNKG